MKHYPAAFINVIYEGKNFDEAIKYLQETWNELCEVKERCAMLEHEIKVSHNVVGR